MVAGMIKTAVVLSTAWLAAVSVTTESPAQEPAVGVAFVEAVSGQVVAFSRGGAVPLETLAVIGDRTRLELQANSELRICHYGANRVLTVRGPGQALVSRDGVTSDNTRVVDEAAKCAAPGESKNKGGLMMRGKPKTRPVE